MWVGDTKVRGLYTREFASGKSSFAVRKREGKRVLTITLGDTASLSVEDARRRALVELGRKEPRVTGTTLQHLLSLYLKERTLKPRSVQTLHGTMNTHFADWLQLPIRSITKQMVKDRLQKVLADAAKRSRGRVANPRGTGTQFKAARYIRSLFRFAVIEELIDTDPTAVLSSKKVIKKLKRKKSYLLPSHRKALLEAIGQPTVDPGIADLIRVLLFTGCRISEALGLRAGDVDAENRYITFRDTKNGLDHVVAYSSSLDGVKFPLCWKDGTPIINPYDHFAALGEVIKYQFSPHDLRRTWATVADELEIPRETIKACLNHISGLSEVTEGYIVRSPERLRSAFQQVDDAIRGSYAQEVRS